MKVTFHGEGLPVSREYGVSPNSGQLAEKPIWHIAEEVPAAFVYNRRNYAVMMATPADLADFALGFSLTENIIDSPADITSLDIYQSEKGVDFRFKIRSELVEKFDIVQRRRSMIGSASCGLCGLENADVLFQKLQPVRAAPKDFDLDVIYKALASLGDHQPLGRLTRSVHGAGWATLSGEIIMAREDVGRHNALDKLLGAMAVDKIAPNDGFIVMSSRCSYEIIEKAAKRGALAIASISAPTTFALRKAEEANMAVYTKFGSGAVRLV